MTTTINASTSAGLVNTADTSGVLQLQTANTTAVTIDASQNVGIGTASPDAKLTIKNPNVSGAQTVMTVLGATSSVDLFALTANQTTDVIGLGTNYAGALAFNTNSTERMRISSTGSVTINSGTLGFAAANGVTTPTGNGQGYIGTYGVYGTTITGQGSAYDISFFNKNQSVAGYVATGATTITTSSDERLKENLTPITNALATVNSLRTVTGNYKTDPSRNVAFFIAQDMEQHFPQAFEGSNPDAYGINYNWTNPLLAAAIKELNAKVDAQVTLITDLTTRLAALEGAK